VVLWVRTIACMLVNGQIGTGAFLLSALSHAPCVAFMANSLWLSISGCAAALPCVVLWVHVAACLHACEAA
jgi:hypothetical protein